LKPITFIAPQTAAAVALCVTDRADVQPIGCKLSPAYIGLWILRPNSHARPRSAV